MCMHVSIPSFAVFCNTLWILLFQVLAYAQQSRERSNYEQAALVERMQEFKRQIDRESRWSPNGINDSPNGDGIQAIGRSSHKMIEAVMQSASKGKVAHSGCPGS
jgi:Arf-GAP/coiled-coil/ANK repeat/PH domain-containing protein